MMSGHDAFLGDVSKGLVGAVGRGIGAVGRGTVGGARKAGVLRGKGTAISHEVLGAPKGRNMGGTRTVVERSGTWALKPKQLEVVTPPGPRRISNGFKREPGKPRVSVVPGTGGLTRRGKVAAVGATGVGGTIASNNRPGARQRRQQRMALRQQQAPAALPSAPRSLP